jgi:hypothetical protein
VVAPKIILEPSCWDLALAAAPPSDQPCCEARGAPKQAQYRRDQQMSGAGELCYWLNAAVRTRHTVCYADIVHILLYCSLLLTIALYSAFPLRLFSLFCHYLRRVPAAQSWRTRGLGNSVVVPPASRSCNPSTCRMLSNPSHLHFLRPRSFALFRSHQRSYFWPYHASPSSGLL